MNIVNISDSELSNCMAQNTDGRVYSTRNSDEIRSMLREASEEVSASASCNSKL
ncbi:hypothetical protein HW090_17475 [Pseudomonas sp. ABC1]|uniref:hypothetical protein n=1 Tax=Pseudomonas sp. ABC1 TaxID=2748080 RepID=UPI0015C39AC9|nr:hypothetical protein [Pseudomonas sp. ABC1]QLF94876.1 hypothetical protein HW090_17475 [Pseudomonas sp. ABC1]